MRDTARRTGAAVATLVAVVLSVGGHGGEPGPVADNLETWNAKIAAVPQPAGAGCLAADFPRLTWRRVACAAAPTEPMAPRLRGPGPVTDVGALGGGANASTPAGELIAKANGSFQNVVHVQHVDSVLAGVANVGAYTLQLNTNTFAATVCGVGHDQCKGWKQFLFANEGSAAASRSSVYIQYWIQHYFTTCPGGWTEYVPAGTVPLPDDKFCYFTPPLSGTAFAAPVPVTNLAIPTLLLTGEANVAGSGQDKVTMNDGLGHIVSAQTTPPIIPTQTIWWTAAEFNVFGYGNTATAVFNDPGRHYGDFGDTSLRAKTEIDYGGTKKPVCNSASFSAESNNLTVENVKLPNGPGLPAIVLPERLTGTPSVQGCMAAAVLGDTHEQTVAGTLYDFQATGDFVEAQIGSAFEVQTRKVSGAPIWPNASLNRSVATRMGTTRVALCDGTRLVVNGTTTPLASGATLSLPTGVTVRRVSNVYLVKDQSTGNNVRIAANLGANYVYNDVQVGVGDWPQTVRGLAGNPDNDDPTVLAAADGARFSIPLSFNDLYGRYGTSWRVNPLTTMLSACTAGGSGNPATPFYASNLPNQIWGQAYTICQGAGIVVKEWLDACTLDVGVLGPSAAAAYVGREPAAVSANPIQPAPPCSGPSPGPVCVRAGRTE
ncbi:hypothetical protein [Hamadaea tsunoensis]|uniref:hypothetical protein n=1 Tax=Hamadaea tsunoensis TaxID=53368 RepID=UPI0012FAEE6F|nr:hypothetical protein [Hamadaea tsunoensis]